MAKAVAERGSMSSAIREYFTQNPEATLSQAVQALKSIGASMALISKIKYSDNKPRKPKRGRKRRLAQASSGNSQAAPERGAKAEAIREAFRSLGKKARPSEVVARLAASGIQVSYSQVIGVRDAMKRKRAGRKAAKGRTTAAIASSDSVSLRLLLEAKALADKLGGVEKARRALATLARLEIR